MLAPLLFNTSTHPKYPLGSRTVVFEAQAVLIHDEEGFYALSTTCTHFWNVRLRLAPMALLAPATVQRLTHRKKFYPARP